MTFSPKATHAQRQKAVAGLVAELNADKRPILLGPYRSELGFEASYWLPFLTWLAKRVKGFDQRASVVTRGGLAPLYQAIAHQGFDLYALRSVTEVRRENLRQQAETGLLKQMAVTPFDEGVLDDAADALKVPRPFHVVHPAWMYWALEPFWAEDAGLKYLMSLADYSAPIAKPALHDEAPLPPKFVAVKFYARHTFPYPHPEVGEWVQQTVATIAAQAPVVLLSSSPDYDDHMDVPLTGPNIISLNPGPPEVNLYQQAQVLGKATAFVGTYGGVAQLALRMGIPSLSVYAQWSGTAHAHFALSSYLSKHTNVPFCCGSLQDSQLWRQVLSVPMQSPTQIAAQMVAA